MIPLCRKCDRSILEKETEYKEYLSTFRKKYDNSLDEKYTIKNINRNDIEAILNDYVITHSKKFDFYFINCEFRIEFDDDFTTNIETPYFDNTNITDIKRYLFYEIYSFISIGHKVNYINRMTINSFSDRCNMTYEHYINQPMRMCERKINLNIAQNPELMNVLDRNKIHPLIRKYSHIPFNNY